MAGEDKTPAISFRVTREQYRRLEELAEERKRGQKSYSVNLCTRDLVIAALEREDSGGGGGNSQELVALREEVIELRQLLLQLSRNLNRSTEGVLTTLAAVPKRFDGADKATAEEEKRRHHREAREWVSNNMPIN